MQIANKNGQLHHGCVVPSHEHGDLLDLELKQLILQVVPNLHLKDQSVGKQEAL